MIIAADVATMRHSDAMTIKNSVPSKELMRRAGEGIFHAYSHWGKTAVVCGSGNNAGDGYVLAMCICAAGGCAELILLSEKFSDDGLYYFEKCKEAGIPYRLYDEKTNFSCYDTVADCIFGTGFSGEVKGTARDCINAINKSGTFTVCADINSGLCGNSGKVCGVCVKSDLTVSVGFPKPGHFLADARDNIGRLVNIDIGIELYGEAIFVPQSGDFADVFPPRKNNTHKGTYGYTAILGGSDLYSGAAKLANLAACALRSGCGVVKLAVPKDIAHSVSPYLLESTLFPMPCHDGKTVFDEKAMEELCKGISALACGMGWGTSGEYSEILKWLFASYKGTLILDADGLNTLSHMEAAAVSKAVCEKIIMTPHPLEFSRISGFSMERIASDPVACAREYAKGFCGKVILLLKGCSTVVTDGNTVYIVNRGAPGMATAGSGDVLCGVLCGIMGYNKPTVHAVACGAFTAGVAGELAQLENGDVCTVASDTVKKLPQAVDTARNG